jgi:hypothetical protein
MTSHTYTLPIKMFSVNPKEKKRSLQRITGFTGQGKD